MEGEDQDKGGNKGKMSVMAFAGGLFLALVIDLFTFLILFIPIIGLIIGFLMGILSFLFVAFMRLSWWIIGYNMKGTAAVALINGLLEALPIWMGCTFFMISSFLKNRANCIAAEAKKGKISPVNKMLLRGAATRSPEYRQAMLREEKMQRSATEKREGVSSLPMVSGSPAVSSSSFSSSSKKVDAIQGAGSASGVSLAASGKFNTASVKQPPVRPPRNEKERARVVEGIPANQNMQSSTTGTALTAKITSEAGARANASAMTKSAIDAQFAAAFLGKKETPEEAEKRRIKEREELYAKDRARIQEMNQRQAAEAKRKEETQKWMDEQAKKKPQVNKPISSGEQAYHAEKRNTEYSRNAGMPSGTAHIGRSDGVRVTSKEEREKRENEEERRAHWWKYNNDTTKKL